MTVSSTELEYILSTSPLFSAAMCESDEISTCDASTQLSRAHLEPKLQALLGGVLVWLAAPLAQGCSDDAKWKDGDLQVEVDWLPMQPSSLQLVCQFQNLQALSWMQQPTLSSLPTPLGSAPSGASLLSWGKESLDCSNKKRGKRGKPKATTK